MVLIGTLTVMAVPPSPLVALGAELSSAAKERYARHTLLPELGSDGQRRLANARVLVIGAGGLGSPALLYLAAAGIGTIAVVDDDTVSLSNLQRQIVHSDATLGEPKVDSAIRRLREIAPDTTFIAYAERATAASLTRWLGEYDVVLDGADNFPTRYAVSQACVATGTPHVWASVLGFNGQLSVWWPGAEPLSGGPCLRCVYAFPPAAGSVPSCAEAGVLGAVCGVLGSLQAVEAIKLITGIGAPLVGRLMLYDALAQQFSTIPVLRNPHCPGCGVEAGRVVVDTTEPAPIDDLTPRELASLRAGDSPPVLVDVRTAAERAAFRLDDDLWVRVDELPDRLADLPTGARIVFYCAAGMRSMAAARRAQATGREVAHLAGGVAAWRAVFEEASPVAPGVGDAVPDPADGASDQRELAERVIDFIATIPPGKVMSYGDVGRAVGTGPRIIGNVLARYGSDSPWWRVIRADGRAPAGKEDRTLQHWQAEGTPQVQGAANGTPKADMARARWSVGTT